MKKRCFVPLTALAFATLPWQAYAQNSVTLYGIVDVGGVYTTNAGGAH
jgi:predicted porin